MILVTGGAGYIGSHTALELQRHNQPCIVLDDLSRGHRQAVPEGVPLIVGSIDDEELLHDLLTRYPVEAVIHFAAESQVGESMTDPGKYFRRNVGATAVLLDVCTHRGIKNFIFSSTAAVYGESKSPIREDSPTVPTNVYGQTKLMIENMLEWYHRLDKLNYVALRYFNAAGADPEGLLGEDHRPETHLIPLLVKKVLADETLQVYGNDYPTPDGTCIRDYIHVTDLARAHWLALQYLAEHGGATISNLGSGQGYSVFEIIQTAERVLAQPVSHHILPPRSGDPIILLADTARAEALLGWRARYRLEDMIQSVYQWTQRHPEGYAH